MRMRSSRQLGGSPSKSERQLNALSKRQNRAGLRRNEAAHIV